MTALEKREAFLIELSDKLVPRSWDGGYPALSDVERVFVCVWELESGVNNGGFDQYYFNSTGDNAVDAEAALRRIGAEKMADLVAQANGLFPNSSPPRDQTERQETLDSLAQDALAKLDELDNAFFAYPDDLSQLLHDFVIEHRSGFPDLS